MKASKERQAIERALKAGANAERAKVSLRFFKSGEGEYGAGDQMLGLTAAQLRQIAKEHAALSLRDIEALLASPWHEFRAAGLLVLAGQFRRVKSEAEKTRLYRAYLKALARGRVNNWDLVDLSAYEIVGAYFLTRDRAPLYRMARSKDLWTRRVAMVSTYAFIRAGEWKDTVAIAKLLLEDRHDLIHKASGWMLREMGKRVSEKALVAFLEKHAATMPRTMLRYAIERFPQAERKRWMTVKR